MKSVLNIVIASTLLLASCGGAESDLDTLNKQKEEIETAISEKEKELKGIKEQIEELDTTENVSLPNVSTHIVETSTFNHTFQIQGALFTNENVIVSPEAAGIISSLKVSEGTLINKGDVIANLDAKLVYANKKQLKEQLETAKYMYDKQKSLFDQGVGTELAVKQAEGQYNSLLETVKSMDTQASMYTLRAPFTGYVEELFVVQGQMAAPGMPIIRLVNTDNIKVRADISESYLSKIDNNAPVSVDFPALDDTTMTGLKITRIGKFINPTNRTVTIEVDIPNPSKKHIPNLMAVLNITDYLDTNAVAIPSSSIIRNMGEPFVFVLNDENIAEKVMVEIGMMSGNLTEITSGLEGGETLVNEGSRELKAGKKVQVVENR